MQTDDQILEDGTLGITASDEALSRGAADAIGRAARWGRYYLYVMVAYLALVVVIQIVGGAAGAAAGGILGIGFMLLLFGYPIYKFWRFAHDTPAALRDESGPALAGAIAGLGSSVKYLGVALIVILGFYLLFFVGALFFGLSMGDSF